MAEIVLPAECSERVLIELLARQPRVNAGVGKKRIEFLLKDGHVIEGYTHDQISRGELERSAVVWPDDLDVSPAVISPE